MTLYLASQRLDGRLHPFPAALKSRNDHQRNSCAHIDHQFLSVLPVFSVYWMRSSVLRLPAQAEKRLTLEVQ